MISGLPGSLRAGTGHVHIPPPRLHVALQNTLFLCRNSASGRHITRTVLNACVIAIRPFHSSLSHAHHRGIAENTEVSRPKPIRIRRDSHLLSSCLVFFASSQHQPHANTRLKANRQTSARVCRGDGFCLSLVSVAACVSVGSIVEGIGRKRKKKMRLSASSCVARDTGHGRRGTHERIYARTAGRRLEAGGRTGHGARGTGDRARIYASMLRRIYASTGRSSCARRHTLCSAGLA